jgi:hypothetical protein
VGCCYAAGAIVRQCHNCLLHNAHAPGTCLQRRCPGNMYVFMFLGSCNCSIVVVSFVAEETGLPSSYLKTTVCSGPIIG